MEHYLFFYFFYPDKKILPFFGNILCENFIVTGKVLYEPCLNLRKKQNITINN